MVYGIKLNLFLHVVGREPDGGRHWLQHVCVPFAGSDVVHVEPAAHDSLTISGTYARHLAGTPPQDNFILRSLAFIRAQTGADRSYKIHLEKNTPAGSGLGAGSYNAANFIKQIRCLGDALDIPDAAFAHVAAEIPLCLQDAPQFVEGVGEKLTPLDVLPQLYPVIVWPGESASTGAVFAQFARHPQYDVPIGLMDAADFMHHHNSLTDAAVAVCPAITAALSALRQTGAPMLVRMTGSGSSCFGLYETQDAAHAAAAELRRTAPSDWWIYKP